MGKKIIWLHAVSVGEVLACRRFLEMFTAMHPEYHLVLTTVTPTGQAMAKKFESKQITVCYFPFDLTFSVRNFFKMLGPECLLLMETELWPNLLTEAKRFRVPVGILNGRLSERSARRYGRVKPLLKGLFHTLDFLLLQSQADAERFIRLGVPARRTHVLGNMKFDNVSIDGDACLKVPHMKNEWGFKDDDLVFVAGSTHRGEELKIVRQFLILRSDPRYQNIKLILAPRHIERSRKIAEMLKRKELKVRQATDASSKESFDVLLVNCLGVLKNLYAIADIVFVGGSFIKRGGQNPIEPAAFKKAVLHGPHVFNFKLIYQKLDAEGGAIFVRDEGQLLFAMKQLLAKPLERKTLGENAFRIIHQLQGSSEHHVKWISKFLSSQTNTERMKYANVS